MIVTNNDIIIDPNDKWYFQANQIINPDILQYFKKNIVRDKTGYFIINSFDQKSEKSYLTEVQGFPLKVLDITLLPNDSGSKWVINLDSQKTKTVDINRLFYFGDDCLAIQINDDANYPLYARLNVMSMAALINYVDTDTNGQLVVIHDQTPLHTLEQKEMSSIYFKRPS